MYHGHRVAVVIPAYNEESWIVQVVGELPPQIDWVVVVDDASTDHTAAMVRSLHRRGLVLVRHNTNRGVGAAIATGYRHAFRLGVDLSIVMGGDGQMDPGDLDALMAPIVFGRADYVKGNRFLHHDIWSAMPLQRLVGNVVLSWGTRYTSGYRNSFDSQCGYTAITGAAARRLGTFHVGYGYCNDVLARLHGLGVQVSDVSVRPIYNGAESGIRLRTVVYPIGWVLAKSWIRRLAIERWPASIQERLGRLFSGSVRRTSVSGDEVFWVSTSPIEEMQSDAVDRAFADQPSFVAAVSLAR